MPSPATPHRASNRGGNATTATTTNTPTKSASKQKSLDIGQPLGPYDTNSVRAKVRKWQQQGGGVVVANDAVYYEEEEDEENTSTVDSSLEKPAPARGRASHSSKARSSSTPRKRVISDEHWKLNRHAPQSQTPQPKLPPPNKRVAEYTSNDTLGSPRREKKDAGREDRPRPSPVSRSRERNRASAPPDSLYRHRKSKSSKDLDTKFGGQHDTPHHERLHSSSRPRSASKSTPNLKSEGSGRHRTKSLPPGGDIERTERSRGPPPAPEPNANKNRTPLKAPPKGGIFTHMLDESKKMFAKPEPPKLKGSRIDTWLSGTPDPFVRDAASDVEIPAPLNMKMRTRRSSDETKVVTA